MLNSLVLWNVFIFFSENTFKRNIPLVALEKAMYPTIRSGLAKFDVSLPEGLQRYVTYLLDESAKRGLHGQGT